MRIGLCRATLEEQITVVYRKRKVDNTIRDIGQNQIFAVRQIIVLIWSLQCLQVIAYTCKKGVS